MTYEAETKAWRPSVYARLSDEDRENKVNGASLSIDHQIDILRDFVIEKGWQEPLVFFDDDRTGTNFNRRGFQDMYAEAQKGNINVIVIKDTSRFGRNWVQSGDYFTRIEEMGIRFISIQEGIDTIDPKCPALKMLPFYFIFNEWHSQTTSEKIRAVFSKQAEQGKYRCAFAPLGYAKDPNNRHKLVIDPVAAETVKRIFEMRLDKYPYRAIAWALNDEGIPSPSRYCADKYGVGYRQDRIGKWAVNTVKQILSNPVYCGDAAHGKSACASYKNQKQIAQPQEMWIVVKDMHEPIISREDFQRCADIKENIGRVRSTQEQVISLFSGLLFCANII
jgi:DNA invertase Pin-like site-specific DNA recombinase